MLPVLLHHLLVIHSTVASCVLFIAPLHPFKSLYAFWFYYASIVSHMSAARQPRYPFPSFGFIEPYWWIKPKKLAMLQRDYCVMYVIEEDSAKQLAQRIINLLAHWSFQVIARTGSISRLIRLKYVYWHSTNVACSVATMAHFSVR